MPYLVNGVSLSGDVNIIFDLTDTAGGFSIVPYPSAITADSITARSISSTTLTGVSLSSQTSSAGSIRVGTLVFGDGTTLITAPAGSNAVSTGSNTGTGIGVFLTTIGTTAQFKSLSAGPYIGIQDDGPQISISADLTSLTSYVPYSGASQGVNLASRSITANTVSAITISATTISANTISAGRVQSTSLSSQTISAGTLAVTNVQIPGLTASTISSTTLLSDVLNSNSVSSASGFFHNLTAYYGDVQLVPLSTGKVAIGLSVPHEKLHVSGSIITVGGVTFLTSASSTKMTLHPDTGLIVSAFPLYLQGTTVTVQNPQGGGVFVSESGRVGINTQNPIVDLHVTGSISAASLTSFGTLSANSSFLGNVTAQSVYSPTSISGGSVSGGSSRFVEVFANGAISASTVSAYTSLSSNTTYLGNTTGNSWYSPGSVSAGSISGGMSRLSVLVVGAITAGTGIEAISFSGAKEGPSITASTSAFGIIFPAASNPNPGSFRHLIGTAENGVGGLSATMGILSVDDGAVASQGLVIATGNNNVLSEKLRISSGGLFGLGTSAALAHFHVTGSISALSITAAESISSNTLSSGNARVTNLFSLGSASAGTISAYVSLSSNTTLLGNTTANTLYSPNSVSSNTLSSGNARVTNLFALASVSAPSISAYTTLSSNTTLLGNTTAQTIYSPVSVSSLTISAGQGRITDLWTNNLFDLSNNNVIDLVSNRIDTNTTLSARDNVTVADTKQISSPSFVSGIFGDGYRIDSDNTIPGQSFAEFDNVRIRGTLRANVFQKDVVRFSNGFLLISDGTVLSNSLSSGGSSSGSITAKEQVFQAGDIVWIKDIQDSTSAGGIGGLLINSEILKINDSGSAILTASGIVYSVTRSFDGSPAANFAGNSTLVRIGSTGNSSRSGVILLDSSSDASPFIDIIDSVTSVSNSSSTANPFINSLSGSRVKVRLGQLRGITSPTWGALPNSHGLWGQNIFLEGNLAATAGYIGTRDQGWGVNLSAITSSNVTIAANSGTAYIGLGSSVSRFNNRGVFIGLSGDSTQTPVLSLSSDVNNWLDWDGQRLTFKAQNASLDSSGNLNLSGSVTAFTGQIGGWTIGTNTLSSNATSNHMELKPDAGIWMGADSSGSSPFIVTKAGNLTATNALLRGSLSASTLTAYSGYIGNGSAGWIINPSSIDSANSGISINAAVPRIVVTGSMTASPGSLSVSGTVSADAGSIGNWRLGYTGLSGGLGSVKDAIILDPTTPRLVVTGSMTASPGSLSVSGTISADQGSIGNWRIGYTGLSGGLGTIKDAIILDPATPRLVVTGSITANPGSLSISGTISANAGNIGGWKVDYSGLSSSENSITLNSQVPEIKVSGPTNTPISSQTFFRTGSRGTAILGEFAVASSSSNGSTFYVGKILKNLIRNSVNGSLTPWVRSGTWGATGNRVGPGGLSSATVYQYGPSTGSNQTVSINLYPSSQPVGSVTGRTMVFSYYVSGDTTFLTNNIVLVTIPSFNIVARDSATPKNYLQWTKVSVTGKQTAAAASADTNFSLYWRADSTTGTNGEVWIAEPQIEESEFETVYQPTDAARYIDSDSAVSQIMWSSRGGFGGYPQNPAVGISSSGLFVGASSYDGSRIVIASGGITGFQSATPIFRLGIDGNLTLSGAISSNVGNIGGWTINSVGLLGGVNRNAIILDSSTPRLVVTGSVTASPGSLSVSGTVSADVGSIGSWRIGYSGLSGGVGAIKEAIMLDSLTPRLVVTGSMTASPGSLTVSGTISAFSGQIGNWSIGSDGMSGGVNRNAILLDSSTPRLVVTGGLTAIPGNTSISGQINADSGRIGGLLGWDIQPAYIYGRVGSAQGVRLFTSSAAVTNLNPDYPWTVATVTAGVTVRKRNSVGDYLNAGMITERVDLPDNLLTLFAGFNETYHISGIHQSPFLVDLLGNLTANNSTLSGYSRFKYNEATKVEIGFDSTISTPKLAVYDGILSSTATNNGSVAVLMTDHKSNQDSVAYGIQNYLSSNANTTQQKYALYTLVSGTGELRGHYVSLGGASARANNYEAIRVDATVDGITASNHIYGVRSHVTSGYNAIAIYGTATGGTNNWAGYFNQGNVFVNDRIFSNRGVSALSFTAFSNSNAIVLSHPAAGRMQFFDVNNQKGLLSWSTNSINLGWNTWEDGVNWQYGTNARANVFRVLSSGFHWGSSSGSGGNPQNAMALDVNGNLSVSGSITSNFTVSALAVTALTVTAGTLRTSNPSGYTAGGFKLGVYTGGAATLDTGGFIPIEINGVVYNLALVTIS